MSAKAARPKDAATLVLVRGNREVLMGLRHPGHAFLPGHHVFPGGGVDRADHYIRPLTDLAPGVAAKLRCRTTGDKARALGLAAIRETFEETGLRLGRPATAAASQAGRSRSPTWRAFHKGGMAPTLHVLDYVARAVTPPHRPRRFDARFFVADATHAHGAIDGTDGGSGNGDGELLDLQWVAFERTRHLTLARITGLVIALVRDRLADGGRLSPGKHADIPMVTYRRGQYVTEYL